MGDEVVEEEVRKMVFRVSCMLRAYITKMNRDQK